MSFLKIYYFVLILVNDDRIVRFWRTDLLEWLVSRVYSNRFVLNKSLVFFLIARIKINH